MRLGGKATAQKEDLPTEAKAKTRMAKVAKANMQEPSMTLSDERSRSVRQVHFCWQPW